MVQDDYLEDGSTSETDDSDDGDWAPEKPKAPHEQNGRSVTANKIDELRKKDRVRCQRYRERNRAVIRQRSQAWYWAHRENVRARRAVHSVRLKASIRGGDGGNDNLKRIFETITSSDDDTDDETSGDERPYKRHRSKEATADLTQEMSSPPGFSSLSEWFLAADSPTLPQKPSLDDWPALPSRSPSPPQQSSDDDQLDLLQLTSSPTWRFDEDAPLYWRNPNSQSVLDVWRVPEDQYNWNINYVCMLRKSDGVMVKLICPDCGRLKVLNWYDFCLHTYDGHDRSWRGLDAAMELCGRPVEMDDTAAAKEVLNQDNGNLLADLFPRRDDDLPNNHKDLLRLEELEIALMRDGAEQESTRARKERLYLTHYMQRLEFFTAGYAGNALAIEEDEVFMSGRSRAVEVEHLRNDIVTTDLEDEAYESPTEYTELNGWVI